jgi:excisionase family DNA binding protein
VDTGSSYWDDEMLEVPRVARHLRVSDVTVYRWCREGRLPCLKIGRTWRIRRSALEDFLKRGEQPATLVGQLGSFLRMPDNVIAIAQTPEMLNDLDSAFFRVGVARGGMIVKFHAWGENSVNELRERYRRDGLEVAQLEEERRLRFRAEQAPPSLRKDALRLLVEEETNRGRTIWASFNWAKQIDLEEALRQQEELTKYVRAHQLVVMTAALESVAQEWPPASLREAQAAHTGMFWLSEKGLAMSRVTPLPGEVS